MALPHPTDLIPHRDPFLLVDEIVELEPGVRAHTRWTLSPQLDVFRGHFPGNPILPGVMIVEALAQTGGIAGMSMPEHKGKLALFAGIDKVRFRRPVRPSETLDLITTITRTRGSIGFADGEATVDGQRACTASISFALVDADAAAAS